jgi:hypothetical protein
MMKCLSPVERAWILFSPIHGGWWALIDARQRALHSLNRELNNSKLIGAFTELSIASLCINVPLLQIHPKSISK